VASTSRRSGRTTSPRGTQGNSQQRLMSDGLGQVLCIATYVNGRGAIRHAQRNVVGKPGSPPGSAHRKPKEDANDPASPRRDVSSMVMYHPGMNRPTGRPTVR
jgi:hypothetical protein